MQSLLDGADVDSHAEQEKALHTIFSSTVFFWGGEVGCGKSCVE